jgi:hypothetical protein
MKELSIEKNNIDELLPFGLPGDERVTVKLRQL